MLFTSCYVAFTSLYFTFKCFVSMLFASCNFVFLQVGMKL